MKKTEQTGQIRASALYSARGWLRFQLTLFAREELELLEFIDLELFGVKILVSILIESFLATVV